YWLVSVVPERARALVLPESIQFLGGGPHPVAIAARLADQQNGREPARLEAPSGVDEQLDESIVRERDRPGLRHVAGRILPAALGHVGDDWRHQRLADRPGDLV